MLLAAFVHSLTSESGFYSSAGGSICTPPSIKLSEERKIEQAIAQVVLEACQPMAIEASLRVLSAEDLEQDQKKRRLELALERVRYEAEYAQRQYDAVDPCNRLVAAELEARWKRR